MPSHLKTFAKPLIKRAVITAGLEATPLLKPLIGDDRGLGAIFTLHHVRPRPGRAFQPNDILDITPDFLEKAILALKAMNYEFIRLEDISQRFTAGAKSPFACFTLDDGYRDNAEHAAPVFAKHGVPFTIFLTKGFVEATHSMWWETLEALLNRVDQLEFDFGHGAEVLSADTRLKKQSAFDRVAAFINTTDEAAATEQLDAASRKAGLDPLAITRELTMRAEELKTLAADPLVSYGAHTISHRGLARLPKDEIDREIDESRTCVDQIVGYRPRSFAYPYGDARSISAGVRRSVSERGLIGIATRPGTVKASDATDLTALPRISLNGHYQKARYVRALVSGIPFRLMGG